MAKLHLKKSPYGYTPTKWITLLAMILFLISTLLHIFQAVYYTIRQRRLRSRGVSVNAGQREMRHWWSLVTLVPGGILEVVGWAGRYWSSLHVLNNSPFLMQIVCLILAPAFFSGFLYTMLGLCINKLGDQYSVLGSKWYMIVFICCDVISLVIQAIGGGQAAVREQNLESTTGATHIMVAGILFQLGSMTLFTILGADFVFRAFVKKPHQFRIRQKQRALAKQHQKAKEAQLSSSKETEEAPPSSSPVPSSLDQQRVGGERDIDDGEKGAFGTPPPETEERDVSSMTEEQKREEEGRWKIMLAAVAFSALTIFVRGIYRSIELLQGWNGFLITHEVYFNTLDFLPMILCIAVFNIAHPGLVLETFRRT